MHSRITLLEELSLNAWPAQHTLLYDGWLLRFSEGYTNRANSVNPIYSGSNTNLENKIKACKDFYTQKNLPTIFKLTPASLPSNLEMVLASNGFSKSSVTSVQEIKLNDLESSFSFALSNDDEVKIIRENQLRPGWLATWLSLTNISTGHWANVEKLLGNILPLHCFLRLEKESQTVAAGLAVYERGYVGLFDIVTNTEFRRQGLGRRLVIELLKWGQSQGAATAYLQVLTTNSAALQLYTRLGFREVYQYWYRVKTLETT